MGIKIIYISSNNKSKIKCNTLVNNKNLIKTLFNNRMIMVKMINIATTLRLKTIFNDNTFIQL